MPNSSKLGLMCVLLLSACGTTAAQVSVSGSPATTVPSSGTAEHTTASDNDDRETIHQLAQFVHAAEDAYWTDVRDLTVPGVTLLAADQPSVGPGTISLALVGDSDYGTAILSPSGTCLWYASVDQEDRFGSGETCTADAAYSGSAATLSADSPWHVMDPSVSTTQAVGAQSALRNALVAAKTFYSDAGTFNGISPETLAAIEPSLVFVSANDPSIAPDVISVAVIGDQFGAAALSANGTCYWIAENVGLSSAQYGHGTPCTGTAALTASGSAWKPGE